ncbi:MAG: sulfotransferase-like domain-containing protein [Planctomycetota bacterium]
MSIRIAMWSGPRNISTAMMRSWGNRPDTLVCDEPFYAHYLAATGRDHPGAEEVIAQHENDPDHVIAWLTGPVPGDKPIFYQKHMAHHLLADMDRDWLDDVTNCFLIRDPREMLTSLVQHLPDPTLQDTGLPRQVEIFWRVADRIKRPPPVLDAKDVLQDPKRMLGLLCDALGVKFTNAMLSWPPGRRATDGIWAKHWYQAVEASTSFQPYTRKYEPIPAELSELYDDCIFHYAQLHVHRLR